MNLDPASRHRRRIRWLTGFFIFGLFFSGVTAMPLQTELGYLNRLTGARGQVLGRSGAPPAGPAWAVWLCRVEDALTETNQKYPFIGYGGDWLAFGHFMIALVFVWAWRDPVRYRGLFDFGLIACALVIPFAFICGSVRGIPFWWRLLDCSFGVFGAIPLWLCRREVCALEAVTKA